MELCWNVYRESFENGEIKEHNIFHHDGFAKGVKKLLQECNDKDEFCKKLKSELMYYYWSKAEWEVIVSPWLNYRTRKEKERKIDVYDQVMLNWEQFSDYIWNYGKSRKGKKPEKSTDWVCTDDSCAQHYKVLKAPFYFAFVEAREFILPDGDEGVAVCYTTLDLSDYDYDELEKFVEPYYKSLINVVKEYGYDSSQIIAECIFEQMDFDDMEFCYLKNSFEEAEQLILDKFLNKRGNK